MYQAKDPWMFVRRRSEQLVDEGEWQLALQLMKTINLAQAALLDEWEEEYEQTENC